MNIPEAAVNAALKAVFSTSELARDVWQSTIRDILEAAAPHMLADAWDEGSIAGWVESGLPHSWNAENSLRNANPHRTAR